MNCKVCHKDTTPVLIEGQSCCSVCHTPYQPARARSMDLSRRPGAQAARPAAASLHTRTTSSHILDLSTVKDAPVPAAPSVQPTPRTMAKAPATTVHERHVARFEDRFEKARVYSRSAAISKYGQDRFGNIQDPHKMYDKFGNRTLQAIEHGSSFASPSSSAAPAPVHHPPTVMSAAPQLPHLAATQHAAMNQMAFGRTPAAPAGRVAPVAARAFTMAAAILIMGGYIWLQNYPKMAIQTADSRSGVQASLPSFMPSSYNLATTSVAPGMVTLKFSSPSSTDSLTIAQERTDWDPSSLLSNYIAKTTDDYAAVQGQGLTIYMFGRNQATWVNRGIWYSINGATRLSRDDILKIAYSL